MEFTQLLAYIVSYNLGDYASVLGVLISILGFGVTVYKVWRSNATALQVKLAVQNLQRDLQRMDVISKMAEASRRLSEIKRLQRENFWSGLPVLYEDLRAKLIDVRDNAELTDEQTEILRGVIYQTSIMETSIESALKHESSTKLDSVKYNQVLSKKIDELQAVFNQIRNQIGSGSNDR
jgi:hypothetical protein